MRRLFVIVGWSMLCLAACSKVGPAEVSPPVTGLPGAAPASTEISPPASPAGVTQLAPLASPLSGEVILTESTQGIFRWDLASQTIMPIFVVPPNGAVNNASLSPDGTTIVMSYAPPPAQNRPQLGYTNLYSLPADGSGQPVPITTGDLKSEFYFTPTWSPDGQFLYYGHYREPGPTVKGAVGFFLERMAYPGGQGQVVSEDAYVPRLSSDGGKLVYISVDPDSYLNSLVVANPDGTDPVSPLPAGTLWAIDSLAISPDGQTILVGADSNGPSAMTVPWYFALLGIKIAQAHNIAEDLWSLPITGGEPQRLTSLGITGLAFDLSPDGQQVLFMGDKGVYVMNADGTGLTQLMDQPMLGSIQWHP